MKKFPKPAQFDGAKFAARYGLDAIAGDFFVDGEGMLNVPDSVPDNPVFEAPDPRGPSITEKINALPGNVNSQVKEILLELAKGR